MRLLHISPAQQRVRPKHWLIGLLLSGLLVASVFEPADLGIVTCWFHSMTGLSCPTCGLTRSLHAAMHLRLYESFRFHPLGIIGAGGLIGSGIISMLEIVTQTSIRLVMHGRVRRYALWGILSGWFLFWIVRLLSEIT
jgi:hypothetical protein